MNLPTDKKKEQDYLKSLCAELRALPEGWIVRIRPEGSPDAKRIYFQKWGTKETNYAHPTLGHLPKPWILRLCSSKDGPDTVRYFNRDTRESIIQDPRFDSTILKQQADKQDDPDKKISGAVVKMTANTNLDQMYRDDIGGKNIRHHYNIIHAIDPGDGSIGGMNGGVFVVKLKGQERLSIEKRFKENDIPFGRKEIAMLHRLKHGSLTFYVAAFITPPPNPKASVYVEFCDRGSLEDLIKAYQKARRPYLESRSTSALSSAPRLPERFLWHAFGGLADGLAYLRGGCSYINLDNNDYRPLSRWAPILHRDIKPDNVLIRSRDTLGKNRYFYCVLSDFGLACEDYPPGHPSEDPYQKAGSKLGTSLYYAPELLYHPYPSTENERRYFPRGYKHSEKTDLWSLAASIYCLAYLDGDYSHIDMSTRNKVSNGSDWQTGTISRKKQLRIPGFYSKELEKAVLLASQWNPRDRPGTIEMVKEMKALMKRSGYTTSEWKDKSEEIPDWATRRHEYHAREPLDPRRFGN